MPPIGARFIDAHLARMREQGQIMPDLRLKVPGMEHPWTPIGELAKRLLHGYSEINAAYAERHGRNHPAFSSLLHRVESVEPYLEILNGKIEEEEAERDFEVERRDNTEAKRRGAKRRRCGSTEACTPCLLGTPAADLAAAGIQPSAEGFCREGVTASEFRKHQRDGKRSDPNGFCQLRGTSALKHVFYG